MTRFHERKRGPAGPCLETDLSGVLASRLPLVGEGTVFSEAMWTATYLPLRRPR